MSQEKGAFGLELQMYENTCSKTTNTWSNSEIFSPPDYDIHVHMYRCLAGFSWRSRAALWTPNTRPPFLGTPCGRNKSLQHQTGYLSVYQTATTIVSVNKLYFFFHFHLSSSSDWFWKGSERAWFKYENKLKTFPTCSTFSPIDSFTSN